MLNETDASEVSNNHVERVKNPRGKPSLDTEGKGIFIYGGGINTVEGNSFEACDIGAGVAMGGEGTVLHNNRFVGNRLQVRYIGSSSGVEQGRRRKLLEQLSGLGFESRRSGRYSVSAE